MGATCSRPAVSHLKMNAAPATFNPRMSLGGQHEHRGSLGQVLPRLLGGILADSRWLCSPITDWNSLCSAPSAPGARSHCYRHLARSSSNELASARLLLARAFELVDPDEPRLVCLGLERSMARSGRLRELRIDAAQLAISHSAGLWGRDRCPAASTLLRRTPLCRMLGLWGVPVRV